MLEHFPVQCEPREIFFGFESCKPEPSSSCTRTGQTSFFLSGWECGLLHVGCLYIHPLIKKVIVYTPLTLRGDYEYRMSPHDGELFSHIKLDF